MFFFFFNDTATTEIYTLSLHDALPISFSALRSRSTHSASRANVSSVVSGSRNRVNRSEEHTSELQSPCNLVCRLLLEKKNRVLSTPCTATHSSSTPPLSSWSPSSPAQP